MPDVENKPTYDDLIKAAENELYTALTALETGDLPWARSSSARAASYVVEAHQARVRANPPKC
jgi:HEPN domain-containing protein